MDSNNTHFSDNDSTVLTADNISEALAGLPRRVAFTLKALTIMRFGSVKLTIPGGRTFSFTAKEPGPHAEAQLHNWGIVRRALSSGSLGVAESYVDGDWDSPDVTSFLQLFLKNAYGGGTEQFFQRNPIINWMTTLRHWFNRNTKSGSKRNISAHYDLGNSFYSQWLDPSMTYSSAIFRDGANSLEEAQHAKYQSLVDRTDIRPDHHVLEIGCGWGGFAEYVAKNVGANVTCLTISQEQFDFAQARMSKAGLNEKVTIKFQDYRDEQGIYDRIGSIEMFEAVGESYWPSYFEKLKSCLVSGGKAGIQVITIDQVDFEDYRKRPDFIQKYIFPGGMLPTTEIMHELGKKVGLDQISSRAFGYDYALTLEEWRKRFWAAWPTIVPLGFDERFKRMWEFYFHYCEAGFKADTIDVRQIIYQKP